MYQSPWSWTFNLHAGHSWNDVLTHSKFESLTSFPQVHDKNGVNCLQQRKGLFPLVFAQTLELLGKVETEHRRHLDWSSSLLCSDLSFWLHYTNHQFWWCQQTFPVVFVLRSQYSVTVLTLKKFHETLPAAVRWFPASFSFLSNRCSLKLFQKSILWKRFRITIAVAEYKQGRMDVIKSPGPDWLLWYFHIQPWVIFAMEDPAVRWEQQAGGGGQLCTCRRGPACPGRVTTVTTLLTTLALSTPHTVVQLTSLSCHHVEVAACHREGPADQPTSSQEK